MIQVEILVEDIPCFFEQPTLLYIEQVKTAVLTISRAILKLHQTSTTLIAVINMSDNLYTSWQEKFWEKHIFTQMESLTFQEALQIQ